jgi:hypothetical protein
LVEICMRWRNEVGAYTNRTTYGTLPNGPKSRSLELLSCKVEILTRIINRTDGRGHNRRIKVTSVKAVDNFWCGIQMNMGLAWKMICPS